MDETLKLTRDGVGDRLKLMLKNAKDHRAFFQRVIYPAYQAAQTTRWQTENASEGETWPSLDKMYALQKPITYASYDGHGRKMMIATRALFDAVVTKPKKVVTESTMVISVNDSIPNPYSGRNVGEYAAAVAGRRPFMRFGQTTKDYFRELTQKYLNGGKL